MQHNHSYRSALAATSHEIDQAFDEYGEIGAFLDQGIQQQAEFDVESFAQAPGESFPRLNGSR